MTPEEMLAARRRMADQSARHTKARAALDVLAEVVDDLECTLVHNSSCACRDCLISERDELRAEAARLGEQVSHLLALLREHAPHVVVGGPTAPAPSR